MNNSAGQKPSDRQNAFHNLQCWPGPVRRSFNNPLYVLVLITVSIFAAETIIEVFFENGLHFPEAFLNALFLLVIVFPALYVFMLKPMRAYMTQYDKAMYVLSESEKELTKAKEEIESWNRELEKRVREKSEELKKSQARLIQSEKYSAMGQLAAGLTHELNSPLAGLLPLLEKYRAKAEKGSDAYNELTMMLKAGEHMARIVRDFCSFSRDDKGALVELNLNETIEDTLNFSASQLKKRGIKIRKEYAEGLPPVNADRTGLQQVVLNMVANARDAMPEGGEFFIKTGLTEDRDKIKMEFIDNGQGICEEDLGKIFDPFFTTKKHGDGMGLGLSVSYGIIRKHNGEIFVESRQGRGTAFTIALPVIEK